MKVSVIVSSFDHPDQLNRLLCGLAKQTLLPDEIILTEAGEKPFNEKNIPPRLRDRWIAFHAPQESLAAARERGRCAAHGAVLIFLDDDLMIPDSYIETAVGYLRKNRSVMAVGGIYQDTTTRRRQGWSIAIGRMFGIFGDGSMNRILISGWADFVRGKHMAQITQAEWLFGCNWAIRARAFDHPQVRIETRLAAWSFLEDVIFGARVSQAYGRCMALLPDLKVIHDPQDSAGRITPATIRMRVLYRFIFWRETFDDGSMVRSSRFWLGMVANLLLMCKQTKRLWVIRECFLSFRAIQKNPGLSFEAANGFIFS